MCGQAAVAMLLNISLEESCKLFGHGHKTHTRELVKVLRAKEWGVSDKRVVISGKNPLPDPSVVCVRFLNKRFTGHMRHWAVLWDGEMYCGLGWDKYKYRAAQELKMVKLVSFLPLTPP